MIEPRAAKYQWGQRVVAALDLINDGSFPGEPEGALLAARGQAGEVVQVGHHVEANLPVYLVEFGRRVVGCLEEELDAAGGPVCAAGPPTADNGPVRGGS